MATIPDIGPNGPAFRQDQSADCDRPFFCGSVYAGWESRNCDRCAKGWRDGMGHDDVPCDINRALAEAAFGYGWVHNKYIERAGIRRGPDCPEREAVTTSDATTADPPCPICGQPLSLCRGTHGTCSQPSEGEGGE